MDDHAKQPDMVRWTMLDLRNAISPNRAARAPRQALRSFRPGCQDPGPVRPPGKTSREDIPGRPGVYTHTPNSTVFSTISTKYRAGPRSGPPSLDASPLRELLSLLDACATLGCGLFRLRRLCGDAQRLRRLRRVVGGCARGPCRPGEAAAFPAPSLSGSTRCGYGRGPRTEG